MGRDELAFKILLAILASPDLRGSVLAQERAKMEADPDYVYNPARAFARIAWTQADEFIGAGAPSEQREMPLPPQVG